MDKFSKTAIKLAETVLKQKIIKHEHPCVSKRDSVRLYLDDKTVIVTKRAKRNRAELEYYTLSLLHKFGAPVPRVFYYKDKWIIQEDVGKTRLAQALNTTDLSKTQKLLDDALAGLLRAQQAGQQAALETKINILGQEAAWIKKFIETPERIGNFLKLPTPRLNKTQIIEALKVKKPQLVKWDARPGNAIPHPHAQTIWFDWEHCGCRNALDDIAWLICDEYTPFNQAVENQLFASYLPDFAPKQSFDEAVDYLRLFGVFHICVRLALMIDYKGTKPWKSMRYCVDREKIGATQAQAKSMCRKAQHWAAQTTLAAPLSPWFAQLEKAIV